MAVAEAEGRTQALEALGRANRARSGMVAVRREVKAGVLSVAEALDDPRAAPMTVFDLLRAQRQWGRSRAWRVLAPKLISEGRRVRDLSARQREVLKACESLRQS